MELNAKTIDTIKLPADRTELVVIDDKIPGFAIRLRAGGSRVLIFSYKLGNKNRRMTLGPAIREAFPEVRKRALELLSQVRLGTDPAAAREAAKVAAKPIDTFETVARRYLGRQQKAVRPNTYSEQERYLLTVAKPLHMAPMSAISRRDIAALLSATTDDRGGVSANRLRSALSAMFAWSMREGLVESNPVIGTNLQPETRRDRVLVDAETGDMAELVAVWKALETSEFPETSAFSDVVRLLILTGQRRTEVGGLRWAELDEGLTRIKLPAGRCKNGQEHIIPLSDPAREILRRQYVVVGWPCVFGQSADGFVTWAPAKKALDARLPGDMPSWVLHDLRRSVATGMAHIGILPHVIEAVLNHVSGHKAGVAGIYNHATYLAERTAALQIWAEHVLEAVEGKPAKVIPMMPRARTA